MQSMNDRALHPLQLCLLRAKQVIEARDAHSSLIRVSAFVHKQVHIPEIVSIRAGAAIGHSASRNVNDLVIAF
jgi:hypothetical protein